MSWVDPTDRRIGWEADLESALIKSEYDEDIKPVNIEKQTGKIEKAKTAVEGTLFIL